MLPARAGREVPGGLGEVLLGSGLAAGEPMLGETLGLPWMTGPAMGGGDRSETAPRTTSRTPSQDKVTASAVTLDSMVATRPGSATPKRLAELSVAAREAATGMSRQGISPVLLTGLVRLIEWKFLPWRKEFV